MKLISFIIILFISAKICAQDIIEIAYDYSEYTYQGKKLNNKTLKKLIYASGDSIAIQFYSKYKIANTISIATAAAGIIIFLIGGGIVTVDTALSGVNSAGSVYLGTSIVTGILARLSKNKAIKRFISIQQSNLKVGINRNGIGLRYNF